MYNNDNVFAKIIRGEIPSRRVCENDFALSFYDNDPVSDVHVLVVPKGPYQNLFDFTTHASRDEQDGFWKCVHDTAAAVGCVDACNIMANVGDGTFFVQTVPHFHLHIIAGKKLKELSEIAK